MQATTQTQGIQVTMRDNFMSGWGKATGKKNYYVVECDSMEQAEIIFRNAKKRSEMSNVKIITGTKRWPKDVLVSLKHFSELSGPWKEPADE